MCLNMLIHVCVQKSVLVPLGTTLGSSITALFWLSFAVMATMTKSNLGRAYLTKSSWSPFIIQWSKGTDSNRRGRKMAGKAVCLAALPSSAGSLMQFCPEFAFLQRSSLFYSFFSFLSAFHGSYTNLQNCLLYETARLILIVNLIWSAIN